MTHEIFNCFPLCQYIYLFLNKYIALEVRFSCVGHLIVLLLVYTIELSMRLTSLSKILEGIMICPHARVSACSSQALTACSHMYHANQWRSRTIDTPRIRGARGHRIPEYHWAPWQHDKLRRDYNRLYRFPFSRRSGSYCYEDPRVQSYLGQICTKRPSPLIDTNPAVRTSSVM